MSFWMRIYILAIGLLMGGLIPIYAQTQAFKDTITAKQQQELWKQPDFVKAYLVVAEPGGALYSIFGHACLHLVCEAYDLDYFFTYESEDAGKKVWQFIQGKLKMGMAALTPEEYLSDYKAEGRGVVEYELNLPVDIKRELWRVLDQHVMDGMYLPYDFEARGCAYACTKMLDEALGDTKIEFGHWEEKFGQTRRELAYNFAKDNFPWNLMFIMVMVGTEIDKKLPAAEKLIVPTDLAEVWQKAKVNGEPLLSMEAIELTPSVMRPTKPWVTPNMVALALLVLVVVGWLIKRSYMDWLILGIVTWIGLLLTYLVVFSTLPCTSWNWLIIPFNLLPVIAWKWRKYWALPYAGLLVVWLIVMAVSAHRLIDPSMFILTTAWIVVLIKNALCGQCENNKITH